MEGPDPPGGGSPRITPHVRSSQHRVDAPSIGVWLLIACEIMLFTGLFWLYAVSRISRPEVFANGSRALDTGWGAISVAVLIVGSLSMTLAVRSVRRGQQWDTVLLLALTLVCAVDFLGVKYIEYRAAIHERLVGSPERDEPMSHAADLTIARDEPAPAPQPFPVDLVLIAAHAMHVLAGAGALAWLTLWAHRGPDVGRLSPSIERCGLYWHVVAATWIFFFPLLYLVG